MAGHLIGIIAMALMTIVVLTVGTLAAAGMFEREDGDAEATEEGEENDPGPDREAVGARYRGE